MPVLSRRRRSSAQRGYVALATALLAVVIIGAAALTIDVGTWYVTAARLQTAADDAALSGVVDLPADPATAKAVARSMASANGFTDGRGSVRVLPRQLADPTQLQVSVTQTVSNGFARLLGQPTTRITRTAVADAAGPTPMGSACAVFGDDPEVAEPCPGVTSRFFADIVAPGADKGNGDAFASSRCGVGVDGCEGAVNTEYVPDGYFYAVHVPAGVSGLHIEAFDPVTVGVGDRCQSRAFGSGGSAATTARNAYVTDAATRYVGGAATRFCTGDVTTGAVAPLTRFTVRRPGPNPWTPLSFPPLGGDCTQTFDGLVVPSAPGALKAVLNAPTPGTVADRIAASFRRWVPLCTLGGTVPAGDYLVQVQTAGLGTDAADAQNRFALRATADDAGPNASSLTVSGLGRMSAYANLPASTTEFYLARIPSDAAGQVLDVRLFDAGDTDQNGTVTVVAPDGGSFADCTGSGVVTGPLPSCSVAVDRAPSDFNGRWQTISVRIPSEYTCDALDPTACWVRLRYDYGTGGPTDTTSWTATMRGGPVRLVR